MALRPRAGNSGGVITPERARADRHLVAHRQLSRGRPDLPPRQSAAPRTAPRRTHQAAVARPLGDDAWPQPPVRAPQPRDQRNRPQRHLRVRARPRRTGCGREHLPRRHLHRALPAHHARRGRLAQAVSPVLVSRRYPEPCGLDHAGFDQRRWRARLLARARVRRGLRQPRPHRGVCHRRRRSGDRRARDELALEQVPEPGARRRGASDPAPERVEDRQPDGARTHPRRRSPCAARRLRLRGARRRR